MPNLSDSEAVLKIVRGVGVYRFRSKDVYERLIRFKRGVDGKKRLRRALRDLVNSGCITHIAGDDYQLNKM